ncbi:hypothetical protein [Dactylosporangium sp. CA-139066]|uniref:hypothetical protein n=1 Tax=Dactylosporangium sp. CA-139066 TaxID=3239930 RepID=UPI003D8F62BB
MTATPTASSRRTASSSGANPQTGTTSPGVRFVVAVALLAALAGCAAGRPNHPREPSMPSVTTAPHQDGNPDTSSDSDSDEEDAGPAASTTVTPQAVQAAVAFVTAWARPGLDQPTWLADVSRHAIPEYAAALATVDPANIAAHRIVADAVPQTATPDAADVDIPTDAGTVRVVLVLRDGRWLVADVRPVQESP